MVRLPLLCLVALFTFPATAQTVHTDDDWCEDGTYSWESNDRARYCEVREFSLPARDDIRVDAGKNGGVRIEGWDRDEIVLRARVEAQARTRADAETLADQVTIQTDGTIHPNVPRSERNTWASVSFELYVPHRSNLDLESRNGGIGIEGVLGEIRFDARNGGVSLRSLGGDVRGKTTNGGLHVTLTGDRWDGDRLDVETTNGGVKMTVPEGYSADLETGTVNGGLDIDFPILIEGSVPRRVRTTLGEGGALVRVTTTNGGVSIERG